jgi:hypothetical protein
MENGSKTPDYILARYLNDCLEAFNHALQSKARYEYNTSWIDTTESLPPLKTPILFVAETEVKYGQRGIYTKDDFECQAEMCRDGEYEVYEKQFVTKWMFIPKP